MLKLCDNDCKILIARKELFLTIELIDREQYLGLVTVHIQKTLIGSSDRNLVQYPFLDEEIDFFIDVRVGFVQFFGKGIDAVGCREIILEETNNGLF